MRINVQKNAKREYIKILLMSLSLRMIKKQACESYENAFTCLFFLLYDVLFFFRLKAFLMAEKRWMSLYIIMNPS